MWIRIDSNPQNLMNADPDPNLDPGQIQDNKSPNRFQTIFYKSRKKNIFKSVPKP